VRFYLSRTDVFVFRHYDSFSSADILPSLAVARESARLFPPFLPPRHKPVLLDKGPPTMMRIRRYPPRFFEINPSLPFKLIILFLFTFMAVPKSTNWGFFDFSDYGRL